MSINVLSELSEQFAQIGRVKLSVPEIKHDLYSLPATFEDSLRIQVAHTEEDPLKKALLIAKLIIKKVELEDGTKAFRNCQNKIAARVFVENVPSSIAQTLFLEVAKTAMTQDQIEGLEGKSEEKEG